MELSCEAMVLPKNHQNSRIKSLHNACAYVLWSITTCMQFFTLVQSDLIALSLASGCNPNQQQDVPTHAAGLQSGTLPRRSCFAAKIIKESVCIIEG